MDANTTDGNGGKVSHMSGGQRPRQSRVRAALRELLLIIWLPLGVVLDGILLYFATIFLWGTADAGLSLEGWRYTAVDWLIRQAAGLSLLLLPMIPVATMLWAKAVSSGPDTGRRLRYWAVAIGIVTGVMLILDVLALVTAGHLADLF
jgi:hypothetical protein